MKILFLGAGVKISKQFNHLKLLVNFFHAIYVPKLKTEL